MRYVGNTVKVLRTRFSIFNWRILLSGLVLLSVSLQCTRLAEPTLKRYQYTQLHLGVQVRIVLFAEKEADAQSAARAAYERIADLEDVFSDYRAHSELRRLTEAIPGHLIKVSKPLFTVLQRAMALSEETNGAFDVTVGPLTMLWRDTRRSGALPTTPQLAEALKRVGWRHIQLDETTRSVRLEAAGMQLDAGGLAKGYILDEALAVLQHHEIDRALIEAGGDIVAGAPPPGTEGWSVEVPDTPESSPVLRQARSLSHAAIATSGDTEQFVEIDGVRYSHIVNPRTGLGLRNRRMATVIAPDGITADGYATALTVMDSTAANALLAMHPELVALARSADDR